MANLFARIRVDQHRRRWCPRLEGNHLGDGKPGPRTSRLPWERGTGSSLKMLVRGWFLLFRTLSCPGNGFADGFQQRFDQKIGARHAGTGLCADDEFVIWIANTIDEQRSI